MRGSNLFQISGLTTIWLTCSTETRLEVRPYRFSLHVVPRVDDFHLKPLPRTQASIIDGAQFEVVVADETRSPGKLPLARGWALYHKETYKHRLPIGIFERNVPSRPPISRQDVLPTHQTIHRGIYLVRGVVLSYLAKDKAAALVTRHRPTPFVSPVRGAQEIIWLLHHEQTCGSISSRLNMCSTVRETGNQSENCQCAPQKKWSCALHLSMPRPRKNIV